MEELKNNLKKDSIRDLYDVYLKILKLIEELNSSKKELPPKEEI